MTDDIFNPKGADHSELQQMIFFFSEKIRPDIFYESSFLHMIQIKFQVLFSLEK